MHGAALLCFAVTHAWHFILHVNAHLNGFPFPFHPMQLTDIVVDAVLTIQKPDQPLDLYMVEIMHMRHKLDTDTKLIR